ncbi:alpha/beta hydrolase-fold protein [Janthinobacterium sp. GMG2]|uniref:alpha/beta hydrolase n=1 Tax=Janthinobacterium sp. GMG2 TaxID=3096606 RepID=UPI0029F53B07|nr:alpha/beta hydrolase-fold protein [Janthinobacterium sp. GMG2]MDX8121694.1 alpha/beta hydrolase-fold protein [Janthinobacterium sp. GMG2]
MKPRNLLIVLCCLASSALAAPASVPASYVLENTEVRDIRAQALKRDYQLYVALPDSYRQGNKRYPVLFVVDANYSFPIVRNIAQRLNKHAGMEEVVVVGLSYANGDGGVYSRRRDYTPTTPRKHDYRSDMPGRQPAFGEAKAYGQFISGEVFPFIASNYRVNMQRKVFIGHSYGSLLGLQFLLTEPRTFEHYILGSPSLWYDAGVMFDREQAYAASHKDLPASVFFGIGGLEKLAAGKKRSRLEEEADMLADLREFDGKLKSHKYPGLKTRLRVFEDEDHASVFPFILTHGLRAYLKSSN